MKVLDEIIELLSDKEGSLTDALLKTKVVMHRIGYSELSEWVNDELNGYPENKRVPDYRVIPARLVGNLQNVAFYYSNQTLPTAHLSEKHRRNFSRIEMRESIRVLEEFASRPKGHLVHPVAPEYYAEIGKALDEVWVERAWVQMEPTQILNATIEVRSRLLDFALTLRDKLGDVKESDVKELAKNLDVPAAFQHAVFGNNTVIVMGSENTTNVQNTNTKGDFRSLEAVLKEGQVSEDDIAELKVAVAEDDPELVRKEKTFGPKVKEWMGKMAKKAIDGTWTLGIAAGGKLLADALAAHYGLK